MSFDNGRVREWIGPRIVPVFADEVEWDITKAYEPLVMVQHEGETFMTRQYVPAGIQLPNTAGDEESNDYWVHMSNWNAQVEYYRQEVLAFDGRIDTLEDALPISIFDDTNTVDARFDAIESNSWVTTSRIADSAVTSAKIADGTIATSDIADDAITSAKIAEHAVTYDALDNGIVTTIKLADASVTSEKIVNGTIATADIADGAITSAKIADRAVTKSKIANDDILLIFGDSWGDFEDGFENWSIPLNAILNCNQIINYANGGAAFVYYPDNLISSQITTAINLLTEQQKNNVKYIVIMGGVNDHHPDAQSGYVQAVLTAINNCCSNFPNALVQFVPSSCTPDYDNPNKWLYCQRDFCNVVSMANNSSSSYSNRTCFPACGIAFWFNSTASANDFFRGDKLHLNSNGKNAIVNAILNGFGLLNMVYKRNQFFSPSGLSNEGVSTTVTPDSIQLEGSFTKTDAAISNLSYGIIGQRLAIAIASMYANCEYGVVDFIIFPVISGNGNLEGYVRVNYSNSQVYFNTNKAFSGKVYLA